MKMKRPACYARADRRSAARSDSDWCRRARERLGPWRPEAPRIVAPARAVRRAHAVNAGRPAPPVGPRGRSRTMEVVYERCCGLDIHKKRIVACVIVPGPDGAPTKTIRTFGTMTADLLALADWLREQQVQHVAMESTGVYWQPIYNLL